ncbi:MAG: hypothetical protein AM326_05165 [Candidatus Thorarchaeota archaeon SMTZ-45]|nr:MAG: hypothetical protein AM325_13355 [Candidatus Thorarchaeota archaeon SMTZ1-45]KXH77327.1 MAG: hypothetical protein AM326_05165 [Candidatus Thorarchaeota archaeon SMTZ-45]
MRFSFVLILASLTIVSALLLPMGTVVEVVAYFGHSGVYFSGLIDLSIFGLNSLCRSFPGIEFVFILWIFVASLQALNLLALSRGKVPLIVAWLVFLSTLIAQLYIPSLVLDLALPVPLLTSRTCEPNIICSWLAALCLVAISFGYILKDSSNQWLRVGYG